MDDSIPVRDLGAAHPDPGSPMIVATIRRAPVR
jgi:hypothetical protein